MPERYQLDGRDRALLNAAAALLKKVAAAETLRPAELVSVAKLQHVLSVIPRTTSDLEVTVSVIGPRRKFGEVETWHYWDVTIERKELSISSGGYFYRPSTGGDSFTTMSWWAVPDQVALFDDYSDKLGMVPDARSFPEGVEEIDFSSRKYKIRITDPNNPLLEESECAEASEGEHESQLDTDSEIQAAEIGVEESSNEADLSVDEQVEESDADVGTHEAWSVTPLDVAEERLAMTIDPGDINANDVRYAFNAKNCDFCGCALAERTLFVDGRLRGQLMSGNMCANCFENRGDGLGWGRGQLYARQGNGSWRMVAGFRSIAAPGQGGQILLENQQTFHLRPRAGDYLLWLRCTEPLIDPPQFVAPDFWEFREDDRVLITNCEERYPAPLEQMEQGGPALWKALPGDRLAWGWRLFERRPTLIALIDCHHGGYVYGEPGSPTLDSVMAFGAPTHSPTPELQGLWMLGYNAAVALGTPCVWQPPE